jgi:hypothetical protein
MDIKDIRKLVKLYMEYNPNMNRGIGFRAKTFDIINSYANTHNKSYEDIKHCIESQPMCQKPIWDMFYNYFYKNIKEEKKSNYKESISDSTDANDWI